MWLTRPRLSFPAAELVLGGKGPKGAAPSHPAVSCPHTHEKTPSTSTLGQPHCSWALEVIQTAPAAMTHSETQALLTPVPRFPHHLIGDSQHFPRLPHGAVLRTQIKALCPLKEDDSEAKAACGRGAAMSTRRAVWGQLVRNAGPDRDPKDRSSPCRAGVLSPLGDQR